MTGDRPVGRERHGQRSVEDLYKSIATATTDESLRVTIADLQGEPRFDLARSLLIRLRDAHKVPKGAERWARQQLALCTYKDPDLPAAKRFDRALEILDGRFQTTGAAPQVPVDPDKAYEDPDDRLDVSTDQETLGLAGAILKRKWELTADVAELRRSAEFYERGITGEGDADARIATKDGYVAINAAFVEDLLASTEAAGPRRSERRDRAAALRTKILEVVRPPPPGTNWWASATRMEACVGLSKFKEARAEAIDGLPAAPQSWMLETTVRQIVALDVLLRPPHGSSGILDVLTALTAGNERAAQSLRRGKLGLALSGGGFRASFFHIGVLAALADLDVLRDVEVLSCVSGGSILGARYYLQLRDLLQSTNDRDIGPGDYQALVARLADEFLAGVQRDLRGRLFLSVGANLRSLVAPDARTRRLGVLYEEHLFTQTAPGAPAWPKFLDQLIMNPKGTEGFHPKHDNWRRAAKGPMLVFNATTLNTGHSWQFAATWMGEPPSEVNPEVDAVPRLRRKYHDEAPPFAPRMRLGEAVAASSCVPGLFEALDLGRMYPGLDVDLVDGGVYDNQGVASLLEQDCSLVFVSDASGQLDVSEKPTANAVGVIGRMNNILMERVRRAQYEDLSLRSVTGRLREASFVHLTLDLAPEPLPWNGAQIDEYARRLPPLAVAPGAATPPAGRRVLTRYGVNREVQSALATIRTDLDAFSHVEALSLMASGYRMTLHEYAPTPPDEAPRPEAPWVFTKPPAKPWAFEDPWTEIGRSTPNPRFLGLLKTGRKQTFRAWHVSGWGVRLMLTFVAAVHVALLATVLASAAWLICRACASVHPTFLRGVAIGACAVAVVIGWRRRRSLGPRARGAVLLTVGWAFFGFGLLVGDRVFLGRSRE